MRLVIPLAFAALVPLTMSAGVQDAAKAVADGGISVAGWTGKIDANEEKAGQTSEQRQARAGDGKRCRSRPAPR